MRVHDRLHTFGEFQIPWLRGPRLVRVYVPPPAGAPPPVLYVFDGQNIFDHGPSHAGSWHLHDAARELALRGVVAPVIVGVDHGGPWRIRELCPFQLRQRGQAPHLVRWLANELAPQIQRAFKTRQDVRGTAIGGASMGGLAALYAHFHRPDVFGAALCMSPSFWVAGGKIFKYIDGKRRPRLSRIYLDAGAHEPRVGPAAERMARQLRARGYGPAQLRWVFDPEGHHHERDWRRRAPAALSFLYEQTG